MYAVIGWAQHFQQVVRYTQIQLELSSVTSSVGDQVIKLD